MTEHARSTSARGVTALLVTVLLIVTAVSIKTSLSAQRAAREASQRADLFQQWVHADEAFIDGDRERALQIYVGLAEATGDSSLLRQRFAYDSAERDGAQSPASSERDYARLAARLARTEALLANVGRDDGDTDLQNLRDAELEATIDRQLSEIRRLRALLELRRDRAMLRFTSGKKGDDVVYVGDVQDGRATGTGVGIWVTGSSYDGQWRDNARHGRGVFRWKDGESYDGDFLDDKRTGRGSYVFKTGERWEGAWLDDMRHGEGVLYDAKGKVRVWGRWAKDKLVEEFKDE